MPSLYMVMLGGRHARANTEVHDVVFAIGDDLKDIYPQLKIAWFGEQKGLHIDAWAKLNGVKQHAHSYKIEFAQHQPRHDDLKLFLINLGGYCPDEFGELHRYKFVVAQSASEAKQQAKTLLPTFWQKGHTDRILDIDDCIPVDHVAGRYLHLSEGTFISTVWENTYLILE